MQEISFGTLYDMNKQLSFKEKVLTKDQVTSYKSDFEDFFKHKIKKYAMLLCHEQRDYTLFNLVWKNFDDAVAAVIECCENRGKLVSIEYANDDFSAFEIWIRIGDEDFCYYLFPYDDAVIEV